MYGLDEALSVGKWTSTVSLAVYIYKTGNC